MNVKKLLGDIFQKIIVTLILEALQVGAFFKDAFSSGLKFVDYDKNKRVIFESGNPESVFIIYTIIFLLIILFLVIFGTVLKNEIETNRKSIQ